MCVYVYTYTYRYICIYMYRYADMHRKKKNPAHKNCIVIIAHTW